MFVRVGLLLVFFSSLMADSAIGKVIALEGKVEAVISEGKTHLLVKDAEIFLNETIQTGADGKIQLRFTDGTLLNIIQDSAFQTNNYSYKQKNKSDEFNAELVKGGFRFITGSIAKKNPEQYELKTPTSVIGLRGTIISVSVLEEKDFVGVEQGRVEVSNAYGSILIGEGEEASYTVVEKHRRPETLIEEPAELNPNFFVPPRGGIQPPPTSTPAPSQPSTPAHSPSSSPTHPHSHPPSSDQPRSHSRQGPRLGPSEEIEKMPRQEGGGGSAQIHGGC